MAKRTPEQLARGLVNILKEEGGVAWRDKLIYRLQNSEQVLRNEAFYALTYARSEGLIEHVHNESWYPATMRLPGENRSKPDDSAAGEVDEVEEESELTPLQEGLVQLVAQRRAEQEEIRSTFDAAERYLQFRAEPFPQNELIGALRGILGVNQSLASSAVVHLLDAGFATKSYTDGTLTPVGYIDPEDETSGYGEYTAESDDSAIARGADLSWLLGSEPAVEQHADAAAEESVLNSPLVSWHTPDCPQDPCFCSQKPPADGPPWWVERSDHIAPDLLPDEDFLIRGFVARGGEASAEIHIDGTDYTASLIPGDHSKRFQLESPSLGFDEPFFREIFIFTEEELNPELVQEYFEDYQLGRLTDTEHGWKR